MNKKEKQEMTRIMICKKNEHEAKRFWGAPFINHTLVGGADLARNRGNPYGCIMYLDFL